MRMLCRDYWEDRGLLQTPKFSEFMQLRRFQRITSNLHFADSNEGKLLAYESTEAGLHKIENFLNLTNASFRRARAPGKNLAFDEYV